ncbi:MAG: transposase [Elusimicrobia bacterium]|nr:transposase [Elusimicrobiota bacterium]
MVLDHLEEFALPRPQARVVQLFRKYIECGIHRFGVARYRCPKCGDDVFVPFSCKVRGLCPSCDAKRATVTMANAVDRLLPEQGYRQWVLVVPKRLRFLMDIHWELAGEVASILAREVELFLARRCGEGAPANISFVQRFGSRLNLHPHIHAVISDGVFFKEPGLFGDVLGFKAAGPPTEAEVTALTETLRRKVLRRLRKLGYLSGEDVENMLAWPHSGFSLHAAAYAPPGDRKGLQQLLYYCGRPAISVRNVSYYAEQNRVIYRTEPRGGESWSVVMEPLEFLRKWALLVPPPRKNLVRYYGALGPNSPLRGSLVEAASDGTARARLREKKAAVCAELRSWAACLARVFEVFPLICPKCSMTMVPVAVIMNDRELVRLLTHLGLSTEFPKMLPAWSKRPAVYDCGPPGDDGCQIDPNVDLYEGTSPPGPDEAA